MGISSDPRPARHDDWSQGLLVSGSRTGLQAASAGNVGIGQAGCEDERTPITLQS